MAAKRTNQSKTAYVDGNVVRRFEPARRAREEAYRELEEKRMRSLHARRNQEKALQMSFPFVLFLAAASIAAALICFQYLQLQTSISSRMDHIEQLQGDITDLKIDNKALEIKINTYYDLDYIYQVATQELGMVYASQDQVIQYDRAESEYVRQYDDIPQ
jgi:hypothetical protein